MMSCCENSDIATPPIPVTNQRKYTSGSRGASGFPKVCALIAIIIALLLKHLLPVSTWDTQVISMSVSRWVSAHVTKYSWIQTWNKWLLDLETIFIIKFLPVSGTDGYNYAPPPDNTHAQKVCGCRSLEVDLVALFLLCSTRTKYNWGSERDAERRRENEREKSSVRWPHSDNKPGKSLSLEPFRNSAAVYTGGGWVGQDMQRACILQHLVMNTKHMQHVKSHIHRRFIPGPKCGLSFVLVVTFAGNASFRRLRPIYRSLFEIQSQAPLRDPRAVKHYYPRVSSSECSPPGTEASGWLVCLAAGPSPATTSTWPEFNPRGRLQ